jgi:hypothetical protein
MDMIRNWERTNTFWRYDIRLIHGLIDAADAPIAQLWIIVAYDGSQINERK